MKNPNLYSGLLTLLPDLQADLAYAVEGYTNTYGNIWRWDILPTNTEVEAVYGTLNALIGKCNFLLERIAVLEQEVDDEDYEKLQQFKGEALFAVPSHIRILSRCIAKHTILPLPLMNWE